MIHGNASVRSDGRECSSPQAATPPSRPDRPLELWGGIECTVNRVDDRYFDQIARTGHDRRPDDLDRFAALGLRTLRYPLLWERTLPGAAPDWSWADERLGRMRELGITPILGLLHHGSGPRTTSLLDPRLPERLARYASAVAERYPWVERYTPVNEPLTTARFSCLYGYWYPHARTDHAFAVALLNQCRGIVLAMRAIRAVTPQAQLVQTDDLGRTLSTPQLAYQAGFDNERRWVAFDLLCGRVTPEHPLWSYFMAVGIAPAGLRWFEEHACPPDLIGLNYYLTSERFLDERLARYPEAHHGGNGRDRYADVEAVRVAEVAGLSLPALLLEAWERYRRPLAITECHNGCTREEQLRWLAETWAAAQQARAAGAEVRAVTVWALLGGYSWESLLTRESAHYEPGAFDVRGPTPRATALARLAQDLAMGERPEHPTLALPGWWRRSLRVLYGPQPDPEPSMRIAYGAATAPGAARPLLITGASGTLGYAFARLCELRGLPYYLLSRRELDIADPAAVAAVLDQVRPWALVNTAGYVRVDEAERDPQRCFRENSAGPACLAAHCADRAIALLTFSSDLVFDGIRQAPYLETSPVAPLNIYGRSKAEAEALVLSRHERALVVRTSAFFGPWDQFNFITLTRRRLAAHQPVVGDAEAIVSPTYLPDLIHTALDLLIDGAQGRWHLANQGALSWAELARLVAARAGFSLNQVEARPSAAMGYAAARPPYSVLGSEYGPMLPALEDALDRYWRACEVAPAA